jgi:type I restriction enzyme S subunit
VGTIGRAGVVGAEERFSTDRSLAVIRFDESKVLQPYGFALLTSQSVQRQIQNLSLGSAQPHLYLGDIRRIRLRIPDKAVQVRVLESLNRLAAVQASTKSRRDALIQLKSVCLSTFLESQPLRSKDC